MGWRGALWIARAGRLEAPEIVAMVLSYLAKSGVRAMGAISVTGGIAVQDRIRRLDPRAIFSYFFTYTTLNYHIVPAFLHIHHAN